MHSEAKRSKLNFHFKHCLISRNDDRKRFPERGREIERKLIGSRTLYTFAKNIRLISFSFLSRLSFSVFTWPINYSQTNQSSHKSGSRRLPLLSLARSLAPHCWPFYRLFFRSRSDYPRDDEREKAPRLLSPAIISRK